MVDLLSRSAAILAAALMFAVGVIPGTAHALGLGELSVESGPGEPLRLVIEVEPVSAAEAETLDVSLAGRADFAAAGVEYPPLAGAMDFALVPLDQGGYQVVITTRDAVDDASLRLLVAATWAGGREIREYTASLDSSPPDAPAATSVSIGSAGEGEEGPPDPAGEDARPVAVPGGEFLVESGHTLSHIVLWMNVPEDLHRFRAYLAVFRGNPRAFINNNMNLVRGGAVLQLPTFDEIRTVTYSESVAAYSEQLDQFTAYQQRVRQRRADPEPTPEPQIADTGAGPAAAEPPVAVADDATPAVDDVPQVTETAETAASDEPVRVDGTDPGRIPPPVETPPEIPETIPEIEVAEEPAPSDEEPTGARLTISQQADPDAVSAEDDDQALLDALDTQLAQMDESLLASGEETRSVQENLQQIQKQAENISTLIEVENLPLATAQDRATGEQDGDSDLPASAQAGDGTIGPPVEVSAEALVDSAAREDGAMETAGIPGDQAAPEEPAEAAEAAAEPGTAAGTGGILLAQQDVVPAEDEPLSGSGGAAVPALAEPDEEIRVAETESGVALEPAVEMAAQADDVATEAPAVESTGPLVSGVSPDAVVVETIRVPLGQAAPEEPAEVSEPDAEPDTATGTGEILPAQQDSVAAEEEPLTGSGDTAASDEEVQVAVTESGVDPEPVDAMEEEAEEPAGEVAAQADDGTAEAPAGESAEPPVSGVSTDAEVAETAGIPEDQAAPEEPAEVSAAEAESDTATGTGESLLAQQESVPAKEEPLTGSGGAAVPAPAAPDEEIQVAVTESGVDPEPAEDLQAESVSAVATDEGHPEPVPATARDGLLDWIKNVFAILPDYGPKIAVGLLALLAALFVWQRRKGRRMPGGGSPTPSDGDSSMESAAPARSMHDAAGSDPVTDPATGAAPQEAADAGTPDAGAQGAAAGPGGTGEEHRSGEIDPMVEADVYLEYDRIEQAIEVLRDAYAVDSERGELAEKLLEIYHMQDDRRAFDSLAGELHGRAGLSRNINWDRIVAMGREVSPNNSLFTGEAPLHEDAAEPEQDDGGHGDATGEAVDAPSPEPEDGQDEESRPPSGRESPMEEPDGEPPDTEEAYDESETALELARTYLDLGERDIARGYLEEVLKGGSEDQKRQARDQIRELGD